jgi:hypothetical protein
MGSDRAWGRPTEPTAKFVWSLFEDWLPPVQLDDLLPKRGKRAPASDDEHALDVHIAKQSLVVALDAVITAGDRDAMLTKNALFDALAQRWSRRYRRAALRHGARISYDMRVETVERALRELLVAGVRFDTLWRIVTGRWSRSGLNPFFAVRRSRGKRHALGYHVDVNAGSTALPLRVGDRG